MSRMMRKYVGEMSDETLRATLDECKTTMHRALASNLFNALQSEAMAAAEIKAELMRRSIR